MNFVWGIIVAWSVICVSTTCANAQGLPANPWTANPVAVSIPSTEQQNGETIEQFKQDWQQLNNAVQNMQLPDINSISEGKTEQEPEDYDTEMQNRLALLQQQITAEQNADIQRKLQEKLAETWDNIRQNKYEIPQNRNVSFTNVQKPDAKNMEMDWETKVKINKANREYTRYKNKAIANYKALRRNAEKFGNKVKSSIKTIEKNTETALDKLK